MITACFRAEKKIQEEKEAKKIDPTDFESFSNNFERIEKQHRKAGKKMSKAGSWYFYLMMYLYFLKVAVEGGKSTNQMMMILMMSMLNLPEWKKKWKPREKFRIPDPTEKTMNLQNLWDGSNKKGKLR